MISEEKVCYMVKMAAFEERQGKECEPMKKYFRGDYIGLQMLRSFVTGTLAYAILFGLWALRQFDEILEHLMRYIKMWEDLVLSYLVFMAAYLFITYVVYSVRYRKGRKDLKRFYAYLRKVEKINDEKVSLTQEW